MQHHFNLAQHYQYKDIIIILENNFSKGGSYN